MPKRHKPRKGSLQFWPRSRAENVLPSVNWNPLYENAKSGQKILGFLGYKAGMLRVLVHDLTQNSMTKNKEMIIPATVIECPPLKVYSIRFYKNSNVATEVVVSTDKELKGRVTVPEEIKMNRLDEIEKNLEHYNDIKLILYPNLNNSSIKKTQDIVEIALQGTLKEKFEFAKSLIGKELNVSDVFSAGQLADLHAVTKGFGLQGTIKRLGISKRAHKSEKGVRKPGNLGPWKPSKVRFFAPQAGQTGFFTRLVYNIKIMKIGSGTSLNKRFHRYGIIKNNYIIVKGSVQGPAKRPVLFTIPLRASKKTIKKNYEILKILD